MKLIAEFSFMFCQQRGHLSNQNLGVKSSQQQDVQENRIFYEISIAEIILKNFLKLVLSFIIIISSPFHSIIITYFRHPSHLDQTDSLDG